MFESVDETVPPFVVLREDDKRREETITGGQTEWDLLEVDESLGSFPVVGILDFRETVVGPAGIDGRKGERERREGGRPDSECDWDRKLVQQTDVCYKGTHRR